MSTLVTTSLARHIAAATAALMLVGCFGPQGGAMRYDLRCNGLATQARGAVACLRLDTQSGEVAFINIDQLASLGSSTAAAQSSGNGRFAMECGVSNMPTEATMRCVRLDRASGEMVSLDMSRLPRLPVKVK